jgi:DNA-binding LacI/PurR family transcriptional regulator
VSVTMQDVARRAGVSIKTVSNVMNGYRYISPATKAKVEAAIEELGYRLNVTARNLRARRTGMIGLAVPELSLPYFGELADAVIRAADAVGYTVLIEQTGADRDREIKVLTGERYLTDGLLFSPLALGQDDVGLFDVEFPMVVLGERVFDAPADHVTMNNVEAAYAATRHLLQSGRRRIAVVGAHRGEVVGSAALRLQGYERALAEAGIPVDPALVGEAGLWHRSTGAETMAAMLDAGVEVDAVFALNDALALGALHTLHVRRIDVPEQVAVVGFDDIDEARYSVPPLTTVDPGREQIARAAVDLLVRRITQPDATRPFQRVVADFSIVGRESTGDVAQGQPERVVATVGGSVYNGPARPAAVAPV